jgi:hypothetical protein
MAQEGWQVKALRRSLVAVGILALLGITVGCHESTSPSQVEEELIGFFHVDPAATYLHTCDDAGALDAQPIVLADEDLAPGDRIRIRVVGQFFAGYVDSDNMAAVFSASDTLLDGSELNRVADAVDAGLDFESPLTYGCGEQPTDIPEDFECTDNTTVTIPVGATHLFVTALDTYFGDNTDTDGDFGIKIWKRD